MEPSRHVILILFSLCLLLRSGLCISCYQCNSTDLHEPFQCREYLTSDIDIAPKPCDEVYNAAYCIKHTGRFEGQGIRCFVCNGVCTPAILNNCSQEFEASFCIKELGPQYGGVGTKRYCSSVNMGNYCNYIRQSGDSKEYRSCVFTCDSDGCNAAPRTHSSLGTLVAFFVSVLVWRLKPF